MALEFSAAKNLNFSLLHNLTDTGQAMYWTEMMRTQSLPCSGGCHCPKGAHSIVVEGGQVGMGWGGRKLYH